MKSIVHHQVTRRPGTWGAGFLVRAPESRDAFVVYAFEHDVDQQTYRLVRRRISTVALSVGVAPCTLHPQAGEVGRRAEFCFEIDAFDVIYPHLEGHPEWVGSEAPDVRVLLQACFAPRPTALS
ncbi:MAG: hypothetical protein ACR2LK_09095 [Solirubrobacteraceae bacterium]